MLQKTHTMRHKEDGVTIREIKGLKFDALHAARENAAVALKAADIPQPEITATGGYDNQVIAIAPEVRVKLEKNVSDADIRAWAKKVSIADIAQSGGDIANHLSEEKAEMLRKARAMVTVLVSEAKENKKASEAKAKAETGNVVKARKTA